MDVNAHVGTRDASLGRAALLIECAPLPMVEVDGPFHVVRSVNAAFCGLIGKPRSECLGQPFTDIVGQGEKCALLLDRIYTTGSFETHIDADHAASSPTCWLYAMWPVLGAEARPASIVIQLTQTIDFHQQTLAQGESLPATGSSPSELAEANASTDQLFPGIASRMLAEVALRNANAQVRSATDLAERAGRAKDNFLAAISHELRTPLAPVLVATAALREDARLPADVRAQLGMIERNVALEARLIDDLLDLTKISRGKLHLRSEPCDAHSLIGLAIEIVRDHAREKEITIERHFTAQHSGITADPARIQQVVWNLLRNAVKFTPRGGKISVRTAEEYPHDAERWLRLEVTDTGIGIAPAKLEQIFTPFDQGDIGGDHRFGGVGLGLAITRAVVLLHGGRITAESPGPNRGATFVVELPGAIEPRVAVTDNTPPSLASPALSRELPSPLRLLIVEDHLNTLTVLAQLLRRDGHHVVATANVADALAAAETHAFDLVISDLGLPDGTGVELMEKLRATYGLRGIALSGYGMKDDLRRSSDAGFVTHLIKPVAMTELRRVLGSVGPPPA